ncbi:MAG: tetratricopeptide repeat protein [Candidatus Omnitrophica bacterium]|nr:tetratricopeptide repeat protein [Candidatus Omnitrophota bacterium]
MTIPEEFDIICGFRIFPRKTNNVSGYAEREDSLFPQLAVLYYSCPSKFNQLKGKINDWLKAQEDETILALAGYVYYISEDFKKAKEYFLKAIALNPDNLDNWMDLAFVLRHNGEYRISRGILFNYSYVMYYYKYLKLAGGTYSEFKKMVSEVSKRTSRV